MSWIITGTQKLDPDAAAYIDRVQVADTQPLEPAVIAAINAFVVGCKADGIWSAIKASCILAGARTLNGALVPLAGAAPTNFNFVAGDYDRKTGLVGDGSTKYLDSNRNNNADPQNSKHVSIYISEASTVDRYLIGAGATVTFGSTAIVAQPTFTRTVTRVNCGGGGGVVSNTLPLGNSFLGISRSNSSGFVNLINQAQTSTTYESQVPSTDSIEVFKTNGLSTYAQDRLAFYSIGEALDLALLSSRVTTLINAFAAAIP